MGIFGVREWLFKRVVLGCTNMDWVGSIWVEGVTGIASGTAMLGRYPGQATLLFFLKKIRLVP